MTIINLQHNQQYPHINSICIGKFDGVHLAHQTLFNSLEENGAVVIIGLENLSLTPMNFIQLHIKQETYAFYLKDIKHINAKDFSTSILEIFPNLKLISIGYDFKMGRDRQCDIGCIKKEFKHIQIKTINEVKIDNLSVHSFAIKKMLLNANIKLANKLLGRNYSIYTNTIKGQGIGQKKLYPTINTTNNYKFFLPKSFVYATKISLEGQTFYSISFLGHRKSTDKQFAIETHIIKDFNLSIEVPKEVKIEFIEEIRENIVFKKIDELKNQISKDIVKAKIIHKLNG